MIKCREYVMKNVSIGLQQEHFYWKPRRFAPNSEEPSENERGSEERGSEERREE